MSQTPAPTLDQLAADPAQAQDLSPEVARNLLLRLASLQEALRLRALSPAAQNGQPNAEGDRLLTPEEAARLLSVKVSWLYRHAKQLPFTRRLSRKAVRFSEVGLRKWTAAKRA